MKKTNNNSIVPNSHGKGVQTQFKKKQLKSFNQTFQSPPKILFICVAGLYEHRGFYMSAHVLLNLLNELGKEMNCEACRAFYLFFHKEFNKFNNTLYH